MTAAVFILLALITHPLAHAASEFELTSPAFTQGQRIPTKYTADGEGLSPPLQWSGLPNGSSELVLVMDDPDARRGTYTHWVIYGISPSIRGLPESHPSSRKHLSRPEQVAQGLNSRGELGYTPPSPPSGALHHYHFKLFALDRKIRLPAGLSSQELQQRISKHIRGETELVGIYGR